MRSFDKQTALPKHLGELPTPILPELAEEREVRQRIDDLRHDRGRTKRARHSWALSAALNLAGMAGLVGMTELRHQREQAATESTVQDVFIRQRSVQAEKRAATLAERGAHIEQVIQAQVQLVERSAQELRQGIFDYGTFVLEANHLDQREAGEATDIEAARLELARVQGVFDNALGEHRDPASILQALELAFEGYQHAILSHTTLSDFVVEHRGPCHAGADLVVKLLWKKGFRNIGIRTYAPPEGGGFGHDAPILVVEEGGRRREIDLFSGGQPFTSPDGIIQGTFIDPTDKVAAYAAYHNLPVPGMQDNYRRFPVHAANSHFAYPLAAPTVSDAFPNLDPTLYARGFRELYRSDRGRIYQEQFSAMEQRELEEDAFVDGTGAMIYWLLPNDTSPTPETVPSAVRPILPSEERLVELGESAEFFDQTLQHETRPAERALLLATSACLWEILERNWGSQRFARSYERAHHQAQERRRSLEAMLPGLTVANFFPSAPEQLPERRFVSLVKNLLVVPDQGPRLAFDIASELSRRISIHPRREGTMGDTETYATVFVAANPSLRRLVAEQVSQLPPHARAATYLMITGYQGDHLTVGLPIFENELRFVSPLSDWSPLLERMTGDVQVYRSAQEGLNPFQHFNEGSLDAWEVQPDPHHQRQPAWRSFEDMQHFYEVQANEHHLSSDWARLGLAYAISHVSSIYGKLQITQRPERERYKQLIYPFLPDALAWLNRPEVQAQFSSSNFIEILQTRFREAIRAHDQARH